MAKKKTHRTTGDGFGVIDPAKAYSLEGTAHALGKTKRWVQDNLIRTNAVPYFKRGEFIGIPGKTLILWIESDLRTHREWAIHR